MTPRTSALVFSGLIFLVCLFQLGLALGMPWGEYAMGGAFPGSYPMEMRVAALVQIGVLALQAALVASRAGLVLSGWQGFARRGIWVVVVLLAVGLVLNLITPSAMERALWAPVVLVLLATSLHVALATRSGNRT